MKRLEKIEVPMSAFNDQPMFKKLQNLVEQTEVTQNNIFTELEALKPSILDKAFEGVQV